MKIQLFYLSALILSLGAAAFGQQIPPVNAVPQIPAATDSSRSYLIGPGDVIEARVPGEEDFTFKSTVDDDGKIQVPYSEDGMTVVCHTEKDVRADITKFWSKYLKNPQVSLAVTDRKSRPPVTVTGEVRTPQSVELRRQTRLLELISVSNGPTEDAGEMVQVFRPHPPICSSDDEAVDWHNSTVDDMTVPSRMYSLKSIKQGQDSANPIIFPGDVIIVQKALPVYFTGEVRSPQGIYIKNGSLSLTQAIAQIGGVNPGAKTKDIKIYRVNSDPAKPRDVIAVNYDLIKKKQQSDPMLEPYDIVEVDKAKESIASLVLRIATGAATTAGTSLGASGVTRILY